MSNLPVLLNHMKAPKDEDEAKAIEAALEDQYAYHPWNEQQQTAGKQVRRALMEAARTIIYCVPPGPDRTVALRKLREARMDANSAITHDGKY